MRMLPTPGVSRRGFLFISGGAVASIGLAAACTSAPATLTPAPTPAPATTPTQALTAAPTPAPTSAAATAPPQAPAAAPTVAPQAAPPPTVSSAPATASNVPTLIPAVLPKADFPSSNPLVDDAYSAYPANPQPALPTDPPGHRSEERR